MATPTKLRSPRHERGPRLIDQLGRPRTGLPATPQPAPPLPHPLVPGGLLPLRTVEALLGVSRETVRRMADRGELGPVVLVGPKRQARVWRAGVEEYVASGGQG